MIIAKNYFKHLGFQMAAGLAVFFPKNVNRPRISIHAKVIYDNMWD